MEKEVTIMSTKSLIDAKEVASMLSLNIKTFYRFVKENQDDTFPKPIIFGKKLMRWNIEDISRWIKDRQRQPLEAIVKYR